MKTHRNPSLIDVLLDPACTPSYCFAPIGMTPFRYRGTRATAFALAHDFVNVYVLAVMKPGKRPQRGLFFERSFKPRSKWRRGHWEQKPNSWQRASAVAFCNNSPQALLDAFHEVSRA